MLSAATAVVFEIWGLFHPRCHVLGAKSCHLTLLIAVKYVYVVDALRILLAAIVCRGNST